MESRGGRGQTRRRKAAARESAQQPGIRQRGSETRASEDLIHPSSGCGRRMSCELEQEPLLFLPDVSIRAGALPVFGAPRASLGMVPGRPSRTLRQRPQRRRWTGADTVGGGERRQVQQGPGWAPRACERRGHRVERRLVAERKAKPERLEARPGRPRCLDHAPKPGVYSNNGTSACPPQRDGGRRGGRRARSERGEGCRCGERGGARRGRAHWTLGRRGTQPPRTHAEKFPIAVGSTCKSAQGEA